ncbi:MAG: hypothetical protein DWQ04_12600 [Chloroflexi bacterium]|nr:MAG: hypothetical protein DWQ04_12600 [Chloroflexota bacterium]
MMILFYKIQLQIGNKARKIVQADEILDNIPKNYTDFCGRRARIFGEKKSFLLERSGWLLKNRKNLYSAKCIKTVY